jgi:hypothetical protein
MNTNTVKDDTALRSDDASSRASRVSTLLRDHESLVSTKNSNLAGLEIDYLYHLGLTSHDAQTFKDVKYVCIGGADDRMTKFAETFSLKFSE